MADSSTLVVGFNSQDLCVAKACCENDHLCNTVGAREEKRFLRCEILLRKRQFLRGLAPPDAGEAPLTVSGYQKSFSKPTSQFGTMYVEF
ncbi:MAG: hypothetical protein ACK4NE_01945 [Albidovulum sp.]